MLSCIGKRMMRSTGGDQTLESFEGLVRSTARMFAAQVKREEDDLAQELRVRAWRAMASWKPDRGVALDRYVFQAITNKIKDYKRDAAREVQRRERYGVGFLYIEDIGASMEVFEGRYYYIERDEVYGSVEEGSFVLPASVTEREANVLLLLMMELSKTEIVVRLSLTRAQVEESVEALRVKFADWQPTNSSPTIAETLVAAA